MLLNLLSKEEKYKFIDLVIKVVSADGPTSETEKKILETIKNEMGEEAIKYRSGSDSTEKLIAYFAAKPKVTKNLVFYNLISASLNDEFYSVEEHIVMEQIQEGLEITTKKKNELMKAVYSERDIRERVKRLITE